MERFEEETDGVEAGLWLKVAGAEEEGVEGEEAAAVIAENEDCRDGVADAPAEYLQISKCGPRKNCNRNVNKNRPM